MDAYDLRGLRKISVYHYKGEEGKSQFILKISDVPSHSPALPPFDVLIMHGCVERIQFFCRFVRCSDVQDGKQGELVV